MSFSTTYTGSGNASVSLLAYGGSWNTLTLSKREILELGGAGQADRLTLYYEGMVETDYDWGGLIEIGDNMTTDAVTPGNWFVTGFGTPEYRGPWLSLPVICEGLYAAKPNAARWSSIVNLEGLVVAGYGVTVEVDSVIVTGEPDTGAIGTNADPTPEPLGPGDIDLSGFWKVADVKARNLGGLSTVWLITTVYTWNFNY